MSPATISPQQNRAWSRSSTASFYLVAVHLSPSRVRYLCSPYPRHGRKSMGFYSRGAQDIPDLDAANDEGIADEGTVTAPGDCLCAHDDSWFLPGQLDELFYCCNKYLCLHIVSKTAEGGVVPAGIGRINAGVTQPAQLFHVPVTNSAVTEKTSEFVVVEMGVVSRMGYGPHVHQSRDAIRLQQLDKFVEAASRMTHGKEYQTVICCLLSHGRPPAVYRIRQRRTMLTFCHLRK